LRSVGGARLRVLHRLRRRLDAGGLVGGPLFGACGHLARTARASAARAGAVGAAAPAATRLGEGAGGYWIRLGYHQDALLFPAFGVVAGVPALAFTRTRGP